MPGSDWFNLVSVFFPRVTRQSLEGAWKEYRWQVASGPVHNPHGLSVSDLRATTWRPRETSVSCSQRQVAEEWACKRERSGSTQINAARHRCHRPQASAATVTQISLPSR